VTYSSGGNLNRQETDDAKSIDPPYQTAPAKLQHFPLIMLGCMNKKDFINLIHDVERHEG